MFNCRSLGFCCVGGAQFCSLQDLHGQGGPPACPCDEEDDERRAGTEDAYETGRPETQETEQEEEEEEMSETEQERGER